MATKLPFLPIMDMAYALYRASPTELTNYLDDRQSKGFNGISLSCAFPKSAATSGTAQSGSTSTTIKLATGASSSDNAYTNADVVIAGGTGAGQIRRITGYVGSTRVATVAAWSVTPDATSTYAVYRVYYDYGLNEPLNDVSAWTDPSQAFISPARIAYIDAVVAACKSRSMYVWLVTMWGSLFWDKLTDGRTDIAYALGQWIANRYKDEPHVIHVLLGEYDLHNDAPYTLTQAKKDLINALGSGIKSVAPQKLCGIMDGQASSDKFYATQSWCDFYPYETYDITSGTGSVALDHYNLSPTRPHADIEPYSWSSGDSNVPFYTRYNIYSSLFAGAAAAFWANDSTWGNKYNWTNNYAGDGSATMLYLRRLIESRNLWTRVPNANGTAGTSLIASGGGTWQNHDLLACCMDPTAALAMICWPKISGSKTVDLTRLTGAGSVINAWWFKVSDGLCYNQSNVATTSPARVITPKVATAFTAPTSTDEWVLVLEDPSFSTKAPGA